MEELWRFDFRNNLIVDPNNPLLVMKAWRHRLKSGHASLGRPHDRDALIWNVFRSLEKAGEQGYAVVARFFGLSPVRRMLFWGCDAEHAAEEQQLLSILLRTADGRHAADTAEPDLVVVTDEEVLFLDCHVSQNGRGSPWQAEGAGVERRWGSFLREFPQLGTLGEWRPVYRLLRHYVHAQRMGKRLGKRPRVGSLLNEQHSERLDLLSTYHEPFRQIDPRVCDPPRTWQRLRATIETAPLEASTASAIVGKMDWTLGTPG